ncbi:hypothetical protein D8771_32960 [Streptomyces albus]|uniref:Uncharacterized protein n=1 Tax=Streptomyces albus TaxID=1888 RepID=A0A8H1L6X6_9ACTN|nr:hypothetical protein D8771_32960 [Streptomyces albus]
MPREGPRELGPGRGPPSHPPTTVSGHRRAGFGPGGTGGGCGPGGTGGPGGPGGRDDGPSTAGRPAPD